MKGFRWLARPVLALAVCLMSLLALEGLLRWIDYPPARPCGWRRVVNYPPEQVNNLGHRGRKFQYQAGDFVVLLVGDSQVEAAASPFEEMPEVLLERHLRRFTPNPRVFSIGSLAYGNDQPLLSLREFYAMGGSATMVILWQTIGNDIWDNTFLTRTMGKRGILKPTFRLAGERLIEPAVTRLEAPLRMSKLQQLLHYAGLVDADQLWGLRLPRPSRPLSPAALEPLMGLPVLDSNEQIDRDKSHWSVWLEPESPRVTYGIDLTRALTLEMDRLVREHGGVFVVFDVDRHTVVGMAEAHQTAPGLNRRRNLVRSGGRYYLADSAKIGELRVRINRGLLHVVVPITVPSHTVSATDAHLNTRGNDQVLGALVERLSEDGYFIP